MVQKCSFRSLWVKPSWRAVWRWFPRRSSPSRGRCRPSESRSPPRPNPGTSVQNSAESSVHLLCRWGWWSNPSWRRHPQGPRCWPGPLQSPQVPSQNPRHINPGIQPSYTTYCISLVYPENMISLSRNRSRHVNISVSFVYPNKTLNNKWQDNVIIHFE